MKRIRFVDLEAQQLEVGADVERAISDALRRTDWVLGHDVRAFEEEFALYCGARGGVGTDSGLSALELALRAVGVRPGDEVVIPGNTFIATALAVSSIGATPVLVDVDPRTYLLDPARLEEVITDATRAIVPVHLYGQPADMEGILRVAHRHGLAVVEDACQAHGAWYRRRRAGALGDAAAFSFYPSKNLGAYGDGGMVTSADESLLDEVRVLRNYGQRQKYHHVVKGFNRRLDTLQAAALRVKLRRLDVWNERRAAAAERYGERLTELGFAAPPVAPDVVHVWHLYVVRVADRDRIREGMEDAGIEVGAHYPIPIHRQPAYPELTAQGSALPVVDAQADELLSLPMHPYLRTEDVDRVVETFGALCESSSLEAAG